MPAAPAAAAASCAAPEVPSEATLENLGLESPGRRAKFVSNSYRILRPEGERITVWVFVGLGSERLVIDLCVDRDEMLNGPLFSVRDPRT